MTKINKSSCNLLPKNRTLLDLPVVSDAPAEGTAGESGEKPSSKCIIAGEKYEDKNTHKTAAILLSVQ